MLNRRILRVKAMQGLYAYYNSMDANYNLAIDMINDFYDSQLINDHSIDKKEIEKKKKSSLRFFEATFKLGEIKYSRDGELETETVVGKFYNQYTEAGKKDFNYFSKYIVTEAEKIFDLYLMLLLLPAELAVLEEKENSIKSANLKKGTEKKAGKEAANLTGNRIIQKINSDHGLQNLCTKKKIGWKKHGETTYGFYKNLVKKETGYLKYTGLPDPSFEDDRDICMHIYKDILFKNGTFQDFMGSLDIHWQDDAEVLRSMISKTIKNIQDDAKEIEFSSLSKNWPDDKEFFRDIFEITVRNDAEYDEIISKKSTNWDISRIALTDRIILKMAIGEMIHFPGIPVKVTINEYIELSKNFSTPKSKKFVNGILDVVSSELLEKGVIKKSGRGLIDNQ